MARLESPFDKWLAAPAREGKGLHQELFTTACFLLKEGWPKEEAFDIMRAACDDEAEHRPVPDREIRGAIDYACQRISGEAAPGPVWPPREPKFRAEILRLYSVGLEQLKARIPASTPPLAYLHQLYRKEDLLCIGKTAYEFRTIQLSSIPENNQVLPMCQFINPSPMSAVAGLTASGDWSQHTKSNTGPRVYGVVEFDEGTLLEHAAILRYLTTKLPLAMVVFSGNASLHGWFKTSHVTEEAVMKFYEWAVMLGADPKMFSHCQFSRLPMGRNRATGRVQGVIRFNPANVYYK